MTNQNAAAVILAGGAGSRLGNVDKAFVELAGRPLIEHLLARLRRQTSKIAISANGDAGRFAAFGLDVLADGSLAGKGPLAGVAAGLTWAADVGAESVFTVPVDTPFIPADLISRLMPSPAVAVWEGRQHHLVASWSVAALPVLLNFLTASRAYRVRDILTLCGSRSVAFAGADDLFLNINTHSDLARATELINSVFRTFGSNSD